MESVWVITVILSMQVMFSIAACRLKRSQQREKSLLRRLQRCRCEAKMQPQPTEPTWQWNPKRGILGGLFHRTSPLEVSTVETTDAGRRELTQTLGYPE